MNMKGGVGKTTLAVEISRTLAYEYDKDVLLIDYDPQANASLALLGPDAYFRTLDEGKSIAHCLMPQSISNDPFDVVGTQTPTTVDHKDYAVNVRDWGDDASRAASNLDLVPGNLDLMRVALNQLSASVDRLLLSRWRSLVAGATANCDCVVIDCHPSGSFFTKSALLMSDAAIIPVTSDTFAPTGLRLMRNHMEMWEPAGGAKEFVVIFNDPHRLWNNDVESEIRQDRRFADHCLTNLIPYSQLLRNQASRLQTVAEQGVPYRYRMETTITTATNEMVEYLQNRNIFDQSWRTP